MEDNVTAESAYAGNLYGVLMLDNVVLCYGDHNEPVIAYDTELSEEDVKVFTKWLTDYVEYENNRLSAATEA